jgi:hypothetical protein
MLPGSAGISARSVVQAFGKVARPNRKYTLPDKAPGEHGRIAGLTQTGEENADAHLERQVMRREGVIAVTNDHLGSGPWVRITYGGFDSAPALTSLTHPVLSHGQWVASLLGRR